MRISFFFLLNTEISLPYGLAVIHATRQQCDYVYSYVAFVFLVAISFLLLMHPLRWRLDYGFIHLDAYLFKQTMDSPQVSCPKETESKKG